MAPIASSLTVAAQTMGMEAEKGRT